MDKKAILEEIETIKMKQEWLKYKDHWTDEDYDRNARYTARLSELWKLYNQ